MNEKGERKQEEKTPTLRPPQLYLPGKKNESRRWEGGGRGMIEMHNIYP